MSQQNGFISGMAEELHVGTCKLRLTMGKSQLFFYRENRRQLRGAVLNKFLGGEESRVCGGVSLVELRRYLSLLLIKSSFFLLGFIK